MNLGSLRSFGWLSLHALQCKNDRMMPLTDLCAVITLLYLYLSVCVRVHVCEFMYITCMQDPSEVRKGYRLPRVTGGVNLPVGDRN